MVGSDDEGDILARALDDLGIAAAGEIVAWEEALIVDTTPTAATEQVHAVLAATAHPRLPREPAASGDRHDIRWVAGRGGVGTEPGPVLITVSLTSEEHPATSKGRTTIKIRGVAREEGTTRPWSAARTAVDWLMGMLGDRFDPYDIVEIIG